MPNELEARSRAKLAAARRERPVTDQTPLTAEELVEVRRRHEAARGVVRQPSSARDDVGRLLATLDAALAHPSDPVTDQTPLTAAGRALLAEFQSDRARLTQDYPVSWLDADDIIAIEREAAALAPPSDAAGEGPCGSPANGGPCVLPRGHNRGRADVASNHAALAHPSDAAGGGLESLTKFEMADWPGQDFLLYEDVAALFAARLTEQRDET